jgi:predicted Fe-Mo cluster-binding NifX family protein
VIVETLSKEKIMKLVISSEGPNPTDQVNPRFGRAPYLILFDSSSETFVAQDNSAQVEAAQGAGVQAAQDVVALGADALLTGHCGPKAFEVLSAAGVKIYSGFAGTVMGALRAWQGGELQPISSPDGVSRH